MNDPRFVRCAGGVSIALLGLIAYANTFDNIFVFDDMVNIARNPFLRWTELSIDNLISTVRQAVNRRPVSNVSFALNYYFGGYHVGPYHAVNLLIHIANALLVQALALRTFSIWRDLPAQVGPRRDDLSLEYAALLAGLLFIAHPLQTQSVTYIVQRMNSMATLFYLTALLLYIRGRRHGGRQRIVAWGLAGVSWLIAVGSKENALTLPAAIWLYEWFFFRDLDRNFARRSLAAFWLPLGAAAFLLYFIFIWGPDFGYSMRDFNMVERQLTQFRVLVLYVSLVLFPHPGRLNISHDVAPSQSLFDPITTLISLLALLALFAVALRTARHWRIASFSVLWFFLHLAMESSIISLEMVYEHRTYLPMAGVVLGLSHLLFTSAVPRRAAVAAAAAAVACLIPATIIRNAVWQDSLTLWSDSAAKSPNLPRTHNNLGAAFGRAGRLDEAIEHYREALRIKPGYSDAYRNLGAAYLDRDEPAEALKYLTRATELDPTDHHNHGGLGDAYVELGRYEDAVASYMVALRDYPDERIFNSLGSVLHKLGRFREAAHFFNGALATNPMYGIARINLGAVLVDQGRIDKALEQFFEVLTHVDDAQTHAHIGNAFWAKGDAVNAIQHLEHANRLKTNNPIAMNNLGWMLATAPDDSLRDPDRAVELAAQVLRDAGVVDPGVLDTQAAGFAALGRFDEAVRIAREAVAAALELGNAELAAEIGERLMLYREKRPYVESP